MRSVIAASLLVSASAAGAATVSVNLDATRQSIVGIGGNYAFHKTDTSIGQYTLNNLDPRHARVEIDLSEWEPSNDDGDPGNMNWSSFKDISQTHANFIQMRDLQDRGIPIVASIWDVPNWMVRNPGDYLQRVIPSSMYDEAIESIASYLVYARDHYGVRVQYVSFNEPNSGYNTKFTSSEIIAFIRKAGPKFASLGLGAKWLVGDVDAPSKAVSYVTPILQDASIAPYLGPVSTHSWNWDGASDSVFSGIFSLAKQYGKQVWVEEVGLDSSGWETSGYTSTWAYAFDLARMYYRLIRHMGASALSYWEYGNDYPLVSPSTLSPYPAFHVVKQLADQLPPGTKIVDASSSSSNVLVLSGKNDATGGFMVQMINVGSASETVSISGLPDAELTHRRIRNGENDATVGSYSSSSGSLTITLLPQSINTLYGNASAPSVAKAPSAPMGLAIR